jgi:hypothetical protein
MHGDNRRAVPADALRSEGTLMQQIAASPAMHTGRTRDSGVLLLRSWIVIATLLYVFVTPPFQVSDEPQHFFRSYQLSLAHLLARPGVDGVGAITMGDILPRSVQDLADKDFPIEDLGAYRRFTLDDIARGWRRPLDPAEQIYVPFPNVASYAPTLYAPQILGIVVGRAIGLPPLGLFYLARLMNAMVGIGCVIAATALVPFGNRVFLALAALPTTLYQTASVSPDATIIGLAFLTIALSIRVYAAPPRAWSMPAMILVATLLGLAKGIYLPLVLAGLRPAGPRDRRVWVTIGCCALGAIVMGAWMAYSGGTQVPFHVVSRKTHQMELTAPMHAQLGVVLSNPLSYVRMVVTSFAERAPVYLLQMIGRFGWNAFLMPLAVYLFAAVVLVLSLVVPAGEVGTVTVIRRIWWLLITFGGTLLIETALYLTGTPLGANYIQGTQGRYFLPFLPLLGLAFLVPDERRRWQVLRPAFPAAAALLIAAGLGVALDSFWIDGFVKFEGFPPISWTPVGLARCLLLPSGSW